MQDLPLRELYDPGKGRTWYKYAPLDVVLADTEVVQPDLLFAAQKRVHIITHANIQGAPDPVVEILSPSTENRDCPHKRELYARHGVKELWMVAPDAGVVWVMLLRGEGDDFELAGVYCEGQFFSSPTLGGFAINLEDVF